MVCSVQPIRLRDYPDQIGDTDLVINTIVADTQRLTLDCTSGHSVQHEPLSEHVLASYRHLVDAGCNRRVVANPHPFDGSGVTQQRVR